MQSWVGDAAHVVSLILTFSFVGAIYLSPQIFGKSYRLEGFCVSLPDTLLNSHLLCFYTDTILSALIGALWFFKGRNEASLDRVKMNFPGIFGHGIGHLSLWYFSRGQSQVIGPFSDSFASEELAPLQVAAIIGAILFFWSAFFWSFSDSKLLNVAISVANTIVILFYVPRVFGFTYVQTILMSCFVTRELLLPKDKKDEFYVYWAILVPLPVVVIGWIEALYCDSWVKGIGGHVLYDGIIPLSMLAYIVVAFSKSPHAKEA